MGTFTKTEIKYFTFNQNHFVQVHAVIVSRGGIWTKSVGRLASRAPDNKPEQRDKREYLE
jgi:hypothetical protein